MAVVLRGQDQVLAALATVGTRRYIDSSVRRPYQESDRIVRRWTAFPSDENPTGIIHDSPIETNIVMMSLTESEWMAPALAAAAQDRGVLISVMSPKQARLVTHRNVSASDVIEAGNLLVELLNGHR